MRASDTLLLTGYRTLTRLLGPALPVWLSRRAKAGKEDPTRANERKGIAALPRPDGPLVWMHGASVGECTMLLPLIAKMRAERPDIFILVTSGTTTAAKLMRDRLPLHAAHQYVPLDHPGYVAQFLNHWQPSTAIWAESEIWPNMIMAAKARGIKLALVNARMSEKSITGWTKRKATAAAVFGQFDLILAANETTGNSLSWILDRDIETSGNLKDAAPPLPVNEAELASLRALRGDRPVWCAASTHAGEDAAMIAAHKALLEDHHDALLILAPRHPERGDDIARDLSAAGLTFARRSKGEPPRPGAHVYLFDTIGEMGLAYRLSALTFVCGSTIAGLSGHNPLEPARLGSAVMTGAHIASFNETYMSMFKYGAAKRVLSPEAIAPEICDIFNNPERLQTLQTQGHKFATGRDDVLEYVWAQLQPLLADGTPT